MYTVCFFVYVHDVSVRLSVSLCAYVYLHQFLIVPYEALLAVLALPVRLLKDELPMPS